MNARLGLEQSEFRLTRMHRWRRVRGRNDAPDIRMRATALPASIKLPGGIIPVFILLEQDKQRSGRSHSVQPIARDGGGPASSVQVEGDSPAALHCLCPALQRAMIDCTCVSLGMYTSKRRSSCKYVQVSPVLARM